MKILKKINTEQFGELFYIQEPSDLTDYKYWGKIMKVNFLGENRKIAVLIELYRVNNAFQPVYNCFSDIIEQKNKIEAKNKQVKKGYDKFIKDFIKASNKFDENIKESIKMYLEEVVDEQKYIRFLTENWNRANEFIKIPEIDIIENGYRLIIEVFFPWNEKATVVIYDSDITDEYEIISAEPYEFDNPISCIEE